ncbi:MAG: YezD family protein [Pelosinus sp.]|nr:YezD family protein [Pelosinus sp.]
MAENSRARKSTVKTSWIEESEREVSLYKKPPSQVLEIINHFLFTAENGSLILTVQDGFIVKIEKAEKYIISSKGRETGYVKYGKPTGALPLLGRIIDELKKIQYGQMVIRFLNGKVEQIELTEKKRVNETQGLNGDGI